MKSQTVKKINRTVSLITFSFVLVFGIVFLTLFLCLKTDVPANYVKADATIIRIEEEKSPAYDATDGIDGSDYEHRVFIEYTYNGETYTEKEYGNYDSSMKEGDTVLVFFDPDDPGEFMSDPSGNFVFVIAGIVIILVGIVGIGYQIYQKKKGE